MTDVLIRRRNLAQREDNVKEDTGEDGHLQAKKRGLEQILPSWPSEGSNPAKTLTVDFQTPEL